MYRAASLARVEMIMTQSLVSWCLRDLVKGFNKWRAVAYFWRVRQTQAEALLREKVLEAYPVEHYLPSALPMLQAPMPEIPDLPASNIHDM